eukprot:3134687-Rhodomonas_salina.1
MSATRTRTACSKLAEKRTAIGTWPAIRAHDRLGLFKVVDFDDVVQQSEPGQMSGVACQCRANNNDTWGWVCVRV